MNELYERLPRAARAVLWTALMVGGLLFYFKADMSKVVQVGDYYDLNYYYLNSKYFPELGYFKFYEAMLVADEEGDRRWRGIREYRDLETYKHRPRKDALAQAEEIKARFTPERWEAYKHDVIFLSRQKIGSSWRYFFLDHGYNPPPTWTVSGRILSTLCPIEHAKWITSVDAVLMITAFACVFWAFGPAALFLALLFFFFTFSGTWPVLGQALLRFDWLSTAIMALCVFHRGKFALAGALLAYAGCMRIFPFIFFLPFGAVVLRELVVEKTISRENRLFIAGAAAVVVLLPLVAYFWLGPAAFVEGAHKIAIHAGPGSYSSSRVGFGDFLLFRFETDRAAMGLAGGIPGKEKELWALQPYVRWVGLLAIVLIGLWTVVRLPKKPHLAMPLGVIPLFLLTTPQINYFNCRILLMLWPVWDDHKVRRWVTPIWLMLIELVAHIVDGCAVRYFTTSMTSTLLTVYAAFVAITLVQELLFDEDKRPERAAAWAAGKRWALAGGLAAAVVLPYSPYVVKNWRARQPVVIDAHDLADEVAEGTRWNAPGNVVLQRGGIKVEYPADYDAFGSCQQLSLTLDGGDVYQAEIELASGQHLVKELRWDRGRGRAPRGLAEHIIELEGTSAERCVRSVVVRPIAGDGRFSIGHLRFLP